MVESGAQCCRRSTPFWLLAAPHDIDVCVHHTSGPDDDDPARARNCIDDAAEQRAAADVEGKLVLASHPPRPTAGEHDGVKLGSGVDRGHPPIADIGRSGCRNVGSSMPCPAFLPAMLTVMRRAISASSARVGSAERMSDSPGANRQWRICAPAVSRTRSQLPQNGGLTLAMMPTVAGPP